MFRYNVHFDYDAELAITVTLTTDSQDENSIVTKARRILNDKGFRNVIDRPYTIDLLEKIG